MTQEDKDILLKDLCARLPYGVKVDYDKYACEILSIDRFHEELTIWKCPGCYPDVELEIVKPYLFPMSSMTEEQKEEYYRTFSLSGDISGSVDFYNKNHFDWRGLIPMGLAFDATGKNIY